MTKTVIFDIDGVIADCSHRLHFIQGETKDWDGFFDACTDDSPIEPALRFLGALSDHFKIIFVTGRPERSRAATAKWLGNNGILLADSCYLLMRKDGDHRPDFEVKLDIFRRWIDQTSVFAVIEDRDQVVEMWRAQGLLCLQPKKGDY